MQTASIITIGSEIINGNILNTNGQWIAKQLTNLGFRVQSITGVSDDPVRIADTINHLSKFSKYIITTGGLGATHDDVTREAFNTLFDLNWCCDRNSWKKVNEMTSGFGIENIPYESHKQTLIPADSKRLTNENGTAPGFYLHQDNIHYICLPGVPSEMKEIFCKYVCPMITLETPENNEVINIMLYGVTEEEVNSLIGPIMSANEIEYSILVNEV
ncbi:competence/damage-inducible protein A [Bacillus thuringiensis]|uniref:competence/damage-inducible protein A n=1 Tax=Bacillus thuringiensis TaxID=1428 RepID=UPI002FFEADD4